MEWSEVRNDFPILSRNVYGKPLVYLDNAATVQKPLCVIDCINGLYRAVNANVHRGVHFLSQQATDRMEAARETVRSFIGADSIDEIIFTRGTTESLNLLASSFSQAFLKSGDEIIITEMEHHSNIVPWQIQAERYGFAIKVVPVLDNGTLDIEALASLLNTRTRLISVSHVSNVLGTVNPIAEIVRMAHDKGIPVAVDGAQAVPHLPVDVNALDVDFYAFSGHKMYGPTGIGVLFGKREYLDRMPPYQGGGEMIRHVSFNGTTYNGLPFKFEAGTPDYIGAIAMATAINYMSAISMDAIHERERQLCDYALDALRSIRGIRILGDAPERCGVISFLVDEVHPSDIGTLLDKLGIAVRTGHHCAEPLMERFGVPGTVRASFAMYNTEKEIDYLVSGIERVRRMF